MYQPEYPLKVSEFEGTYKSIKDLKDSIKQDVVILLNVSPGEWPGDPDLGVGVRRFLFESYSSPEWQNLHQRIKSQFSKYLPFLSVESRLETKDEFGQPLEDYNYAKLIVTYRAESIYLEDVVNFEVSDSPKLQN